MGTIGIFVNLEVLQGSPLGLTPGTYPGVIKCGHCISTKAVTFFRDEAHDPCRSVRYPAPIELQSKSRHLEDKKLELLEDRDFFNTSISK